MIYLQSVDNSKEKSCVLDHKYNPMTDSGQKKESVKLNVSTSNKMFYTLPKYYITYYPAFKVLNKGCDKKIGHKKMV